jgi:acyl carrier protein
MTIDTPVATLQGPRNEVRTFISETIRERLRRRGIFCDRITESMTFDYLDMDSLAVVDLGITLDERFRTDIPAGQDFRSVSDLIDYVVKNSPLYQA